MIRVESGNIRLHQALSEYELPLSGTIRILKILFMHEGA